MLVFLVQGMFMTSRLSDVPVSYSDITGGFAAFNLEVKLFSYCACDLQT
jgi:hypothetical protein